MAVDFSVVQAACDDANQALTNFTGRANSTAQIIKASIENCAECEQKIGKAWGNANGTKLNSLKKEFEAVGTTSATSGGLVISSAYGKVTCSEYEDESLKEIKEIN